MLATEKDDREGTRSAGTGRVIDELDDRPLRDAQAAIRAARSVRVAAQLPQAAN
jgi:hypothetical protein